MKNKTSKTVDSDLLVGKKIKSLKLPMTGGSEFDLTKIDTEYVVLFFYPKDMTPGCTVEGHEFSKLKKDFNKHNAAVFGISRDSLTSHEKFITKEKYTVNLLSDQDEKACKIFDVIKEKNMYGKKVMGVVRSTFILDKTGLVVKAWRKVKAEGHAAEVLEFIKSLN